jgi:hypothetical protein
MRGSDRFEPMAKTAPPRARRRAEGAVFFSNSNRASVMVVPSR